jgi:predicted SprT family Zn-dependent metalloprotease
MSQFSPRAASVRRLARQLLDEHGLPHWTFAFNRRKRSLGYCWYDIRTIELSIYLVERNGDEAIRETLLHEIAHALVGSGHGHGPVWQAKARDIGARPERCGHASMPQGRWRALCGSCGALHHRHRKPKWMSGWYCRRCGEERGRLRWHRFDEVA